MCKFWKNISLNQKSLVTIAIIVLIGFVFRAYNFSEWLRFNMDQSRDISLVEYSINNHNWPLLGPKAGGTEFRLGSAFYDFQIFSAKIFGASPVTVAYPDLFFSLLSIPLFFLLVRALFVRTISFSLTWLFAISYFVIKYSRFAWNPNSTPFFVMLFIYSIYRISNTKGKDKNWWAVSAGIAIGICIQMHTTLLIIMPVVALIFAYYLFKNKTLTKISLSIILVSAMFVNIPQIISELKTGGLNTFAFISSIKNKNSRNGSINENLILNLVCHTRANFGIITSYGQEEECGYNDVIRDAKKLDGKRMLLTDKIVFVLYVFGAIIFSLGGYYLVIYELRKEINRDKKIFLKLFLSYVILTFLFFIAWATELSMRFFLILEFVPFLLLGFWLKFLSEKVKKQWISVVIMLVLSFLCLRKDYLIFKDLQFGGREINGNFEYITLGEVNFITSYIKNNNNGNKTAYLDAQAGYLFKAFKSLKFIANKFDLELVELDKSINLVSGDRIFYLKSASDNCVLSANIAKKYEVEGCVGYRQFSIFKLRVK